MQIVKIKYPTENIISLKLVHSSLSSIQYIEVLEIYKYHRMRFFILEKITFKDNFTDIEKTINDIFHPKFFQILERKGNEILCIMRLHRDNGFWPKIISGNWTIIPPIIIDEKYVKETLLIRENFDEVLKNYSKFLKDLEIIAISKIENILNLPDIQTHQIFRNIQPFPHFTQRQHEIALYATRHGYYESPKKIKAEALAAHFNISISALNEHLRKAERTAMRYFFS